MIKDCIIIHLYRSHRVSPAWNWWCTITWLLKERKDNHTFLCFTSTVYMVAVLTLWLKKVMKESESEVVQSCPTLCDPMDCSLPGSSAHGIFQARILEWVAISFSRGSSRPRDWTQVSCIVGRRITIWATRKVTLIDRLSLSPWFSLILCNYLPQLKYTIKKRWFYIHSLSLEYKLHERQNLSDLSERSAQSLRHGRTSINIWGMNKWSLPDTIDFHYKTYQ